jgi:single-strand DNA-binding protein
LAVNRRYKDSTGEWREEASFIPVTVWREAAERCRERLKKGSPVYVEGRLRSTSWETKEGQKRTGIEVEAYRLQFLAKTTGEESAGSSSAGSEPSEVPASSEDASASPSGDEIPF